MENENIELKYEEVINIKNQEINFSKFIFKFRGIFIFKMFKKCFKNLK